MPGLLTEHFYPTQKIPRELGTPGGGLKELGGQYRPSSSGTLVAALADALLEQFQRLHWGVVSLSQHRNACRLKNIASDEFGGFRSHVGIRNAGPCS